jgi:steroid delta-isomerase-like uncharacterized protein
MCKAFSDIAWVYLAVLISFPLVMSWCKKEKDMQPEEIKAIVNREIEEMWNRGDLEAADEIMSRSYVLHEAADETEGIEAFKMLVKDFRTAFPSANFDIDDLIVEGDKAVVRYTFSGKHDGDYLGIASTGKEVTATGIRFSRVAEGKIQETWNYLDKLSILVQLGWWVPPESWQLAYTWGEPIESKIAESGGPDKNKARAQRGLEELWNTGDIAIVDEVYSDNFINHEITHRQFSDLESYKKYVSVIHHIVRDFRVVIHDLIAEGEEVAVHWDVSGRDKTNGNEYAWGGITIFRFSDHNIAEAWWSRDALAIAQQMGIAPLLEHAITYGH